MLSILETLAAFVVLALSSAGLVELYSFSIGEPATTPKEEGGAKAGRILSRVGFWLSERYEAFDLVTREVKASKLRTASTLKEVNKARRWDRVNPYKVLGMCPRCVGVWIAAITYTCGAFAFGLSWWLLLPFMGLANAALSLVQKWRA